MPTITDSEQIEFLLSCVRHANGGKVDFGEVAKECSIVSRGAAAKRYERLSKGRSNAPGGSSADTPTPSPKKTTKSSVAKRKTAPKSAASRKAAAKKGKEMKVEEHSSGEETEIDEAVLGAEEEDCDADV